MPHPAPPPESTGLDVTLRLLGPHDDLEALTSLLHRAYAPLAAAGMRFVASHQTVEVTRRRVSQGECHVAEHEGALVGTVTLGPPGRRVAARGGPALYFEPGVATVSQLAVEPSLQQRGLGWRLLSLAEERARALGAHWLALDTSEHAAGLIAWYRARGYEPAGTCDWRPHTNYRSVLLRRRL